MSDAEGGGGGEEPRVSLLSEASSKADPTTGAPVFDPTANPAAFESQSYITKLVYSVFCLQWHDNVFDRHSPMAPQMYALESRISFFKITLLYRHTIVVVPSGIASTTSGCIAITPG